jgi:hypothetical protein
MKKKSSFAIGPIEEPTVEKPDAGKPDAGKPSANNPTTSMLLGKPVIVRASIAGVHCGILSELHLETQTVTLTNAYRLWRYSTRDITGGISDVGANGLMEPLSKHNIGARLDAVMINNPQGLEIAEATAAAYASIKKAAAK